jgi:GNAT superfamily N-acetyltransferase
VGKNEEKLHWAPPTTHCGVTLTVRDWRDDDDVDEITRLLHRAYASLAAAGLRYMATHQAPEVTLRRLKQGRAFVAEQDGRVIGTVTAYPPDPTSIVPLYRHPKTFHFGQFGVEPDHRGQGIGRALHQAALQHARDQGAHYMALDTAGPASELISTYQRWGYQIMARMSHTETNYESVIMRLDFLSQSQR